MFRIKPMFPMIEIGSYKTYSFLTGINLYTGLGVYGIVISIFGFGFYMEYISRGK